MYRVIGKGRELAGEMTCTKYEQKRRKGGRKTQKEKKRGQRTEETRKGRNNRAI